MATIKFLNINVWDGGILWQNLVQFLYEKNADIVFLQEVYDGQEPDLEDRFRTRTRIQEELQYPYEHFAPTFLEDVEGSDVIEGNWILSRFPLQEVAVRFYNYPFGKRIYDRSQFPFSPRTVQHVIAEVEGKSLHLLNTQGVWAEDGEDSPERLEMSRVILEEVGDHHPLILAGDFNVRPHTETVGRIERKLHSIFKGELETSFNLQHKDLVKYPGYADAVVDMIFVSPDITVVEHACPQVNVSDHWPLTATLAI